jgi:hypothetical protein
MTPCRLVISDTRFVESSDVSEGLSAGFNGNLLGPLCSLRKHAALKCQLQTTINTVSYIRRIKLSK